MLDYTVGSTTAGRLHRGIPVQRLGIVHQQSSGVESHSGERPQDLTVDGMGMLGLMKRRAGAGCGPGQVHGQVGVSFVVPPRAAGPMSSRARGAALSLQARSHGAESCSGGALPAAGAR
ncbi:hypothetical protein EYF80_044811 [Liparis tanakae]|uniref:Uncharacterized protein n=1 Tax=Liparis tanakae TaxID=230148 RepID=A0A4Z2FUX4_9TELE|nr:hypothetical protein EYF80_044811 [Liparis tanakae]